MEPENDKTSPTILVVEDDEQIAYLLSFMLERAGFRVWHAQDGRQVTERLAQEVPDIVLLDAMLPYKSGFELIREMRTMPAMVQVPIIMLTGRSGEQDIVRALDSGANDYIVKPFQPEELLARLRRHLRVRP